MCIYCICAVVCLSLPIFVSFRWKKNMCCWHAELKRRLKEVHTHTVRRATTFIKWKFQNHTRTNKIGNRTEVIQCDDKMMRIYTYKLFSYCKCHLMRNEDSARKQKKMERVHRDHSHIERDEEKNKTIQATVKNDIDTLDCIQFRWAAWRWYAVTYRFDCIALFVAHFTVCNARATNSIWNGILFVVMSFRNWTAPTTNRMDFLLLIGPIATAVDVIIAVQMPESNQLLFHLSHVIGQ